MRYQLQFVLAALILAHIAFCAMEWFWLDLPAFRESLGFEGPQDEVAIVGKNQAFSNLVLAGGLAFGWIAWRRNPAGGCGFVSLHADSPSLSRGFVGFATIKKNAFGFLLAQTIPASIGLALLRIERRTSNTDFHRARRVSP